MSKKYALVIGNNQYDDPNWHDLKTPERDAEAMAAVLTDPKIGGFDQVIPLLNASVPEMRIAIAELFDARAHKPDDLLLLYFSGHGTLDSRDKLFFVGKETRHGSLIRATGLEAGYITGCMDSARSRRQVIILDSCYSGSFGKLSKGGVPTQEIFEGDSQVLFERDKETLEVTGNGYGRHILAATEALQLAWEGDTLQGEVENSFFTQFLVEGLTKGLADRNNDGLIDIEELYDHIREGMQAGKQTPIKRSLHADGKLIIARSPISPFKRKEEQLANLLVQAEKAMDRDDYTRAETLLKNVIQVETNDLLVETAQAMLDDLKVERTRARAYSNVKSLLKKGAARASRTAWKRFSDQYPNYDPDELAAHIPLIPSHRKPIEPQQSQLKTTNTTKKSQILRAEAILSKPFAWIEIPAGQVMIDEKVVQVKPFTIAKYPLTNAQFALFIEAGGYKEKKWWTEVGWEAREKGWDWDGAKNEWTATGKPWTEPRYWNSHKWNGLEQPVVGISWYEAVAFCLWLSNKTEQEIMLPTEEQWQYVAQGGDEREYPWGNEWDCQRCNNSVEPCNTRGTTTVTHYEGNGDSPFGAVDMAGNVWEWCQTDYENKSNDIYSQANYRVLKGGSWVYFHPIIFSAFFRSRLVPYQWHNNKGFRLTLSPDNEVEQFVLASFGRKLTEPSPLTEQKLNVTKKPQSLRAESTLPKPFAWVKIPAGQVTIEDKVLKVEPFAIAKYPLTNAQFDPFIKAGGYKEKKWWTDAGWKVCGKEKWTEPRYWQDKKWNGAEHPVVGVSWYEAVAYCRWLSDKSGQVIILPTEAQWQYAAQGNDGREYPWGNEWDSSRCQNSVDGRLGSAGSTTPVTAYEGKGDSPFGVVDMAGNVWEWCLTEYESGSNDVNGTKIRVLRGGSWDYNDTYIFRAAYRRKSYPHHWDHFRGFRVALSL
ncbi:MAG: SUMF1/EgtB/PvdO family nonheme iron enzyme [Anaerolineae bacterium]|nr:SUMF1/EgtB/PvdO family nonheme iron enzyme [Anaerolineae bacterium]